MNSKRKDLPVKNPNKSPKIKNDLIKDLLQIIERTRQTVALAINSSLTALYWKIGYRIRSEILQEKGNNRICSPFIAEQRRARHKVGNSLICF